MTEDARSPADLAAACLRTLTDQLSGSFEAQRRLLSFDQFLERVAAHPGRFSRNAAQYLLDALAYFGTEAVVSGTGELKRYLAFDAPFDGGNDAVVGNERTQRELVRVLNLFVRERRINRLVLIHGPNGSAKSSLVSCLMRALEAYSHTDEGALYRFNWIFPAAKHDGGRIGFGKGETEIEPGGSYAFLDEGLIDAKLPSEQNDNPLFLLPAAERVAFLEGTCADDLVLTDTIRKGDLSQRSRAVYDALLTQYRGDLRELLRHVQVERFHISKRYRSGAVTVEPQLRVDAGARQLTHDRSLAALPRVLQSSTLFEVFGPLVEGNRGVIEYNDMLKRPMEANKYLLSTSEKGTVSLDTGELHIDALLIATANETYLEAFKQAPDWASYKGRMELIRMPYLLDYRAEQEIYDAQIARLDLDKPVAPHTSFVAALWAVLTRLRRPTKEGFPSALGEVVAGLDPVAKALLYADGALPEGLTSEQAQQLSISVERVLAQGAADTAYEGRFGASPREMKTVVLNAAHTDAATLSPLRIIEQLQQLIQDKSVYGWLRIEPDGDYHRPERFVHAVRELYLDRVEREVRRATGLVEDEEYAKLFERYVQHVNHWLRGEKLRDEHTGARVEPDARFMEDVETRLGRDDDERAYRSHIIARIAAFRIDHPDASVDFERIFPEVFERLREEYFVSKRAVVRRIMQQLVALLTGDEVEEPELPETERALALLQSEYGYTRETALEAVGMLLRARYEATG